MKAILKSSWTNFVLHNKGSWKQNQRDLIAKSSAAPQWFAMLWDRQDQIRTSTVRLTCASPIPDSYRNTIHNIFTTTDGRATFQWQIIVTRKVTRSAIIQPWTWTAENHIFGLENLERMSAGYLWKSNIDFRCDFGRLKDKRYLTLEKKNKK